MFGSSIYHYSVFMKFTPEKEGSLNLVEDFLLKENAIISDNCLLRRNKLIYLNDSIFLSNEDSPQF